MTAQRVPIIEGQVGEGDTMRDRRVLGVSRTERAVYRLTEPLDGITIQMTFRWLQTANMWVQALASSNGTVIRQCVPLVRAGVDLWATVQSQPGMPPGQMWAAWGDQTLAQPLRLSWLQEARLYYRPGALREAVEGTELELR